MQCGTNRPIRAVHTSALRSAAAGDTSFNGVVGGGAHAARLSKCARIRRVMERGQLDIVFQPIVALDSRELVGYEALSRFAAEPRRGPDAWFAEAHEVGLGPELELCAVARRASARARYPLASS